MASDPALNELVVRCLEALDDRGPEGIDAICAEHPEHAERLRARLAALSEAGLLGPGQGDDSLPERLGEFHLLERLGSGGMGVVWLAEQSSLGRRVALKLVRPDQLYFEGTRERFQREVEAVARLAHPGIVPVHAVGEERGIPYFAMEHVAGASLDEVLTRVRDRDRATIGGRDLFGVVSELAASRGSVEPGRPDEPLFAGTWTNACQWIAREVAQALEHAHQRGVLHRDVKPSNVMLTPSGRVLLLDFGLASSGGAARLTRTGSQLGSLPYMAPEQMAAGGERIDARTDVYGLGATLYELLALRPAFPGNAPAEVLQAVVAGRPPRLRTLAPDLSRDLATVVATAMAAQPSERYARAADLARDLSNVLERRPIEARPAGTWLQLVRWAQRQPGAATAMGLGIVLLVGGPTVWALQARHEARRERTFSNQLETERGLAEAGFQRSREAVQGMLARVADETLVDVPRMDGVRRELLADALRLYDELVAQRPTDSVLAGERTQIARSLAQTTRDVGSYDDALVLFDAEIASLRERLSSGEADFVDRVLLAGMLNSRAAVHDRTDLSPEADALYSEALELQRELVGQQPHDPELRHDLAVIGMNLGLFLQRSGAPEAVTVLEDALVEARRVHSERPADPRFGRLLAQVADVSALAQRAAGAQAEAEERFREAIALLDPLLAESPHDRELRVSLCRALANLALGLYETDRSGEGLEVAARATELAAALVDDFPDWGQYQETLAGALINEGIQHERLGDARAALDCYLRSAEVSRRRLAADPQLVTARHYLTAALAHAGQSLLDLGRHREAFDPLLEALDLSRDLVAVLPDSRMFRYYQGMALSRLAALHLAVGETDAAVDRLDESQRFLEWPAEDVVQLAKTWMDAFQAVESDASLDGERAVELLDRCAAGALAALELVGQQGGLQARTLNDQPRWDPLRGEERFEKLLELARTER